MSLLLVAIAALLAAGDAGALTITKVRHFPNLLEPARGENVSVHFRLSEAAEVRMTILSDRDRPVRTIASRGVLPAGDHVFEWDGRDDVGRLLPAEAYTYTLAAEASGEAEGRGEKVVWDLSDRAGGLGTAAGAWDPDAKVVRYRLTRAARVRIRARLGDDGPLMGTVIDFAPRPAGLHEEPWSGGSTDARALGQPSSLTFELTTAPLSKNSILIGASSPDTTHTASPRPHDMPLRLELSTARKRADGTPILDGPVDVQLVLSEGDAIGLLDHRFSAAFFLNGRLLFQDETGFLPLTWRFDPAGFEDGAHHLTVNLLGYEGTAAIATVEVQIQNPSANRKREQSAQRRGHAHLETRRMK